MRSLLIATIFFFAISPLQSQERPIPFPAKNNKDTSKSETLWDAAYWKDESGQFHKFGHVQTQLEHVARDGKAIIRATRVYDLKMTRGRAVFTLDDKQITEESEGKLVRMEYTSSLSRIQKELTALPKGYLISTKTPTENYEDKIGDFPLVGFATELQILKEPRQLEDKFDYYYFEPTLNAAVKVLGKIAGKDRFKSPEGAILEWQRIDLQGAKIGGILPPSASIWVDPKTREIKQTMMEIPGIGYATLVRTTGVQAKAANGKLPDIQANTDIPLSQRVNQIHSLPQMSYRITLEFPIAPGDLLKPSHLHTIVPRQDNLSFELTVKALREPSKNAAKAEPAPPEFLNSSHYITSNDAEVIKLSNTASRGQVNNWDKAQAMESWLNKNFRFVSTKVMDTAAQVANDPNGLSGDCTEVAMLLAAMCRAQGIPSRTAIGVIYADNPKPHFAFHMWTEIYIQGTWLGLDATLGRGSVGPGHIKVTDSSWEGERGQTPLMPVMQFIGKHPKIEVLKN